MSPYHLITTLFKKKLKKMLKYKDLQIEAQRLWNMKTFILPIVIGATGLITKATCAALTQIPGKHNLHSLQKSVVLRTAHIVRKGASHADDLGYLFKIAQLALVRSSSKEGYVRRFVKLWTNFAKYGNPTPPENDLGLTWKPFDEETQEFLNIDTKLTIENEPEKDRVNLWREIFKANPMTANLL